MKILSRDIDRFGSGSVKMMATDSEDMWHAYNLITVDDFLRAVTIRKVQRTSVTGSSQAEKVRMTLSIRITSTEFDASSCELRVTGKNVEEHEAVKVGAFHTIELEPNRAFTLGKENWDSVALERLEEASDPTQNSDAAAVIMQEGLAHVCLLGKSMTILRARIEVNIPRKGQNAIFNRGKGMEKFFDSVMRAILQHVRFDIVKAIIIASPGFVNELFLKHMMTEASRKGIRVLLENRHLFLLVHSSSGYKHDLAEVLQNPTVLARLETTKAVNETRALESFFSMLNTDESRAVYGISHVFYANEMQAIQVLLVVDNLFRSLDLEERKKYVQLVENVKGAGGQAYIFSSLHVSGEQLESMGGLAAILRFPLPDLDEIEFDT